ncbi:MAG: DUF2490 domain-containing protein, partial [Candidatus Melainabacteria bacterium]|nr:DUF2490 domain-containing protein [Candidatus Melainabacteria bacterium]
MLKNQLSILLVILLGVSSLPAIAVENDLGLWTPLWITIPFNKRINALLEISPRNQDNVTKFDQLFIRPSVNYHLNKYLTLTQGYSWNPRFNPSINENRIWEQLQLNNHFSKFNLENRFRLEEIFTKGVGGHPVRGRYRLGTWIPIDKKKMWSFVLWDEFWFYFNSVSNGPSNGYDRNWLFAGLNRKISENVSLEGGYMFQHINNMSPKNDLLNHVILVNLYVTLPQIIRK